jgi:AcrR family transcriptional regulator
MKRTFENLHPDKKQRVLRACIKEFGEHGYDGSSVDRIIKKAEISKGGLYEYVSSKEELFLYTVEYTYTHLYDYLKIRIADEGKQLPPDLLERLKLVADIAIDFYMDHPHFVYLIVRTSNLSNERIEGKIKETFRRHFLELFGDVDIDTLGYPKEQILELAMWMLLKTRMDFLLEIKTERDPERIREDYRNNWDFYLEILKNGIYSRQI